MKTDPQKTVHPHQYVFVHLQNAFDEETALLKKIVELAYQSCNEVSVITNQCKGHLSSLKGIHYHFINAEVNAEKQLKNFSKFILQLKLFLVILKCSFKQKSTLYLNTHLSFGAAFAGKILRHRIIYQMSNQFLRSRYLKKYILRCANELVSNSSPSQAVTAKKTYHIQPFLSDAFKQIADLKMSEDLLDAQNFNVLIFANGQNAKVKEECAELSDIMPDVDFQFIYSNDANALSADEMHDHYRKANVIFAYFKDDEVRTKDMLKVMGGMYYGCPVICHPNQFISSIIENDYNGFVRDGHNVFGLRNLLYAIIKDFELYSKLSYNAQRTANQPTEQTYQENVLEMMHFEKAFELKRVDTKQAA